MHTHIHTRTHTLIDQPYLNQTITESEISPKCVPLALSTRNTHMYTQEDARRREPILTGQDLIQAVLADMDSDAQCLQPLKNAFKRLLQTHRAFKSAEQEVVDIWKPFGNRKCRQQFEWLRSQNHETYVQASSLLKLTSQMIVDEDSDEATKKREEVAQKLLGGAPDGVKDQLDAALEYARCQPLYDHVVSNVDKLLHKCETATLYLERLRKSLPVQQLMHLDLQQQVPKSERACNRGSERERAREGDVHPLLCTCV